MANLANSIAVMLFLLTASCLATKSDFVVIMRWRDTSNQMTVGIQDTAMLRVKQFISDKIALDTHIVPESVQYGVGNISYFHGSSVKQAAKRNGFSTIGRVRVSTPITSSDSLEGVESARKRSIEADKLNIGSSNDINSFNVHAAAEILQASIPDLAKSIARESDPLLTGSSGRRLHSYKGLLRPVVLDLHIIPNVDMFALDFEQQVMVRFKPDMLDASVIQNANSPRPAPVSVQRRKGGGRQYGLKPLRGGEVQPSNTQVGRDRINQPYLPLDGNIATPTNLLNGGYDTAPRVYVIDTGIRLTHAEFEGRVTRIHDQFPEQTGLDGHGTHVASTIGGKNVGVNPNARLYDARALDSDGSATFYDIIVSLEAVLSHCVAAGGRAVRGIVINMSLGGSADPNGSIGQAMAAVLFDLRTQCDAVIVAAAGNSQADARFVLPAGLTHPDQGRVLAVGASTSSDAAASFSNKGPAVFMYAPGVNIPGAWNTNDNAYATISGTSMASPHLAGVASLHIMQRPTNYTTFDSDINSAEHVIYKLWADGVPVIQAPANTVKVLLQITDEPADFTQILEPLQPHPPAIGNVDNSSSTLVPYFIAICSIISLLLFV